MKVSEFRKLIREEVRRVVNEVEQTGKYYYMQFNGTMQPMGPTAVDPTGKDRSDRVSRGPLNKPTDILNVRRFPKNSWKEMDIYEVLINSKPGYVLISKDKRNKWAIIQTDEKFNASVTAAANTEDEQEINNRYRYSYKMAFDAVTSAEQTGEKITPEEFGKSINEQSLNEDMALVGDIALGVVGGLAAVWAIVKGIPVVVGALGMGASSLVDEIQDEARKALAQARRQGRLETIKPIIAKFENDTKLKNMYKDLPPYSTSTSAKGKESNVLRTKQLQEIAEYIKSKLTKDEMQYFTDISSMLRTGDIK